MKLTFPVVSELATRYPNRATAAAALGVHPMSISRAARRYGIRLQWGQASPRNSAPVPGSPPSGDGWKDLAAAVIKNGISVYLRPTRGNVDGPPACLLAAQQKAGLFLEGDMWPFAEVIDRDPETDLYYRRWCRSVGLTAGARAGEMV